MKTSKALHMSAVEKNSPAMPESMKKYSDEVLVRIARKAYELYEQWGRQAGRELEDWLEAEELVRKEMDEACE